MSLLSRDEVRVVLCRDRLVIMHVKGGSRARIVSKQVFACDGPESGWKPVLALLESALRRQEWKKADAMVILSNHFAHFLDLPWNEAVLSDKEKLALVQLRFAEVYGDASANWEFRLSEGSAFGSPSIACAIPRESLNQLIAVFKATPLRLRSVQPYLMTAFNACRKALGEEDGWFVLAERDTFCVGLLQSGQWSSIRLRHVVTDWFEEAMQMLEREAMLITGGSDLNNVFLCAPELGGPDSLKHGAWSIKRLKLEVPPGAFQAERASYAMALAGL